MSFKLHFYVTISIYRLPIIYQLDQDDFDKTKYIETT